MYVLSWSVDYTMLEFLGINKCLTVCVLNITMKEILNMFKRTGEVSMKQQ